MSNLSKIKKTELEQYLTHYPNVMNDLYGICEVLIKLQVIAKESFDKKKYTKILGSDYLNMATHHYLTYNGKKSPTLNNFTYVETLAKRILRTRDRNPGYKQLLSLVKQLDKVIFTNAILSRNAVLLMVVNDTVMLPFKMTFEMIAHALTIIDSVTDDSFPIHKTQHRFKQVVYRHTLDNQERINEISETNMLPLLDKSDDISFSKSLEQMITFKDGHKTISDALDVINLSTEYLTIQRPGIELKLETMSRDLLSNLRKI